MQDKKAMTQEEMKKMIESQLSDAPWNILKGILYGGLGLSGIYGTTEGLKMLTKSLVPVPKIPKNIRVEIPEDEEELNKKSEFICKELENDYFKKCAKVGGNILKIILGGAGGLLKNLPEIAALPFWSRMVGELGEWAPKSLGGLATGIGLGTGGYGAYQLIKYLNNASDEAKFANTLRKIQNVYQKRYETESESEKKACVNEYINGMLTAFRNENIISDNMEKKAEEGPSLADLAAIAIGMSLPIGGVLGYHGLKNLYPIPDEDIEEEERYKPKLEFVSVPKKKTEKRAQENLEPDKTLISNFEKLKKENPGFWDTLEKSLGTGFDFLWDVAPELASMTYKSIPVPSVAAPVLGTIGSAYILNKVNDILGAYTSQEGEEQTNIRQQKMLEEQRRAKKNKY